MGKAVIENYKRYLERAAFYKKFGYDIEKERNFIIEKAKPFCGGMLEVGTGKGYLTVVLAKEGYCFVSVDISDEEQEFARLNIKYLGLEKQVDFVIQNAEHLDFESGRFDIIFSVNLIHHLKNPFKVIDSLIRAASYGCKIVLSDFSKEGLKLVDEVHNSEGRKHKVEQVGLADISKYLSNKKFKIEEHRSEFQEIIIAHR